MTGVDRMMTSRPVSSMLPRAMLRPATLPTMPPPIRPLLASNMASRAMPKTPQAKNTPTITSCPA